MSHELRAIAQSSKLIARCSLLIAKKSCKDDSFQAGDEARSAESLQNKIVKNQSAEGTTEKHFCRAFGTFYIIMVMNAGVSCFALHRLPIFCRHYVTFKLKTES